MGMSLANAKIAVELQDRNLRKLNNLKITRDGYEYRFLYKGGFASYIAVDRRRIGKRNFKYFSGIAGWQCYNVQDAIRKFEMILEDKENEHPSR